MGRTRSRNIPEGCDRSQCIVGYFILRAFKEVPKNAMRITRPSRPKTPGITKVSDVTEEKSAVVDAAGRLPGGTIPQSEGARR
jgi:hypothetical protein